jgi:hypothetical protein
MTMNTPSIDPNTVLVSLRWQITRGMAFPTKLAAQMAAQVTVVARLYPAAPP